MEQELQDPQNTQKQDPQKQDPKPVAPPQQPEGSDDIWRIGLGSGFNLEPANPIDQLPEYLRPLAREELEAYKKFQESYASISATAAAGEKVDGRELIAADESLKRSLEDIHARVKKAIDENKTNTPPSLESQTGISSTIAESLINYYLYLVFKQREQDKKSGKLVYPLPGDQESLQHAFLADQVRDSEFKEDTKISREISTERGLLAALLMKNRGLAIGDVHTQDEAPKLVSENMPLFKMLGVDTLYIEFSDDAFQKLSAMSASDIRELVQKRETDGLKLRKNEDVAAAYGVGNADDTMAAWPLMFAAAKENGIRIVNIDKKDLARIASQGSKMRIAETNFIWTENIEEDRRQLKEKTGKEGKFVVFGGFAHFAHGTLNEEKEISTGMVDEALGIPVIAFERRDKNEPPVFRRDPSKNGPDFYLRGGNDYPATDAVVRMGDIANIKDMLSRFESISGVEAVQQKLDDWSQQYEQQFKESVGKGKPEIAPMIPERLIPKNPDLKSTKKTPKVEPRDAQDIQMPSVPKTPAGSSKGI